ncbi:MAG: response regulator [Nitrospiraceae bacterium]|nr:response regulator [Nitrospiraceae bacterium]
MNSVHTEDSTHRMAAHLAFLAEATPDFLASEDPCTVLDARFPELARLIELAGYEWYAINDKQEPAVIASRGITEPVGEPAASLTKPSPGAVIARQAIRDRQPILSDFQRPDEAAVVPLSELGITDYACFPLVHRDQLLGAMSFATRRSGGWGDDARLLLRIISQCCASALGTDSTATDQRPVRQAGQPLAPALTKLRSLAAQHTVAEEQARRQIARELEDHLSRPLALGRMKLGHVIRQTTTASISALLQDIDEVMDRAVKFTGAFAGDLTPPVLHEQGFQPALQWLAARMEKDGLTVALRLPSKPPILNGNQAILLFHSVRELLSNVLKHAATKRASVTVAYEPTGHLLVSVEDAGQGFEPQDLETGEPHRRFGLFGIRERMVMLNGRMDIRSLPHQGTKVTLVVPAAAPAATEKAPNNGHPTTAPRLRVLLVDDHAMVREGLRSILEGYQDLEVVGEAGDGIEAVKLARTRHPDVVVMDINMPRLDGIAATRQIKHDRPSTAVIGISIQESNQVEQAMMSAGATTFLRKDRAASHLHDAILHAK